VDLNAALTRLGGVAKLSELKRRGVTVGQVETALARCEILRLRKGWYSLTHISPIAKRAIIDRGLLTCVSAASEMGWPFQRLEYHLRAPRPVEGVRTSCRRNSPTRAGACVAPVDVVEDYLHCQPPAWSLALVDFLARQNALSESQWSDLKSRVPEKQRQIINLRSASPESPLESVFRYKLMKARLKYEMQVKIGRFRVDFVLNGKLVVETHGAEFHASQQAWEKDRERVLWLRSQGWDVIELTFKQVEDWHGLERLIRNALKNPRYRSPAFLRS